MIAHIHELLIQRAAADPNAPFLFHGDQILTLGRLNALSDRLAVSLASRFDLRERFVTIVMPNGPEFVISFFACLKLGAKVLPVTPKLTTPELEFILKDSYSPICLHLASKDLTTAGKETGEPLECGPYSIRVRQTAPELNDLPPFFPFDFSKICICIYTSGTTGRPKGALLTHENLLTSAKIINDSLDYEKLSGRIMAILPFNHIYSCSCILLSALVSRSSIITTPSFAPHALIEEIAAKRATVLHGVPAIYSALLETPDIVLPPSLKSCISGGAPLPLTVAKAFKERFGLPLREGYGLTECGGAASVNRKDEIFVPGSVGQPIENISIRVADECLRELPRGETGQIVIQSASNFTGYLNQPNETAKALYGGLLLTGDLGHMDKEGNIYVTDRSKDMLLVNGLNVYPREVEEIIMTHPAVREAAVVGRKDEKVGELPVAFVSLKPGTQLDCETLVAFLKDKLTGVKIPRELHVLESLPRNNVGKIFKPALRKMLEKE